MTKQEYTIIKTVIYICSTSVYQDGERVPCADTDRVIAALDGIFAEEVGVPNEPMLREIWRERANTSKEQSDPSKYCEKEEISTPVSNFLTRFLHRRSK